MAGLFEIMGTGVRALSASQLALNVTSQNISNANTEGYSRKRLNLEAAYRRDPQFGQMGFGVDVTNVTRIRDFFIDRQVNRQTQEMNYYSEMNDTLVRVENIFGEPSDTSISKVLNNFWDSWADLSNNPESIAERDVVKSNAQVLNNTLHNLSSEIRNLSESKNDDIQTTVNQVNEYLKEIYALNKEIGIVEVGGRVSANDSRDQRDAVIKKLSELINVTTEEGPNGSIAVLTNGNMVVSPSNYVPLETATVTSVRPDGTTFNSVGIRFSSTKDVYSPQSGKLRGILESRDQIIPYYEGKLDELANSIVTEINKQHELGYTLNGSTGVDFFKVNSHEEDVNAHDKSVSGTNFSFNPTILPSVKDLGTPDISGGTFVLQDDTGVTYTETVDYTVNYATGQVTLLAAGALGALPAPPATPNLLASYTYHVPRGKESVQFTYASNIELSDAIKKGVVNIAAASGTTTKSFSDTITIPATGAYNYIHLSPGPDNAYGTADDLRERSSIVQGSIQLMAGAVTLTENRDYVVDYPNGQIMLLNAGFAGMPLNIDYKASMPGSNGITDNGNASAIAELRHSKLMADDYAGNPTSTMDVFYNSFISELGVQRNEYTANTDSRQFLVQQFEARQAEISGVSLDEELANLVKFQHTYQASARVVSTVDKMLEILFQL